MNNYSENYYLRKQYLESGELPTQSMIRSKMKDSLAEVYFKSMDSKTRVLAGLDPALKGGGKYWYQPPDELLAGRSVLKPIKRIHLDTLGCNVFEQCAPKLKEIQKKNFDDEAQTELDKKEKAWKIKIEENSKDLKLETALKELSANEDKMQRALNELKCMFSTSFTEIEQMTVRAAHKTAEDNKNAVYENTLKRYKIMVKDQAQKLYNEYEIKLKNKIEKIKQDFSEKCSMESLKVVSKLHDINIEKHIAIEKLRHMLECRNMACQVYIALREREEYEKHIFSSQQKHSKVVKVLNTDAQIQEFAIKLEEEKQKEIKRRHNVWKTKVCRVVKNFQRFVEYCLEELPHHAAFFINMENVMLMQMSEASENPSSESIFLREQLLNIPPIKVPSNSPRTQPHPFHLFCDHRPTPHSQQHLCPKHCSSSASLLPVIVVNNRYFYSACDNLNTFTEIASKYIHNQLEDMDDHDNDRYPINYSISEQLKELQIESSMMRVLQKDFPNTKSVPIECSCNNCKKPYCFESSTKNEETVVMQESKQDTYSENKRFKLSREMQMIQNHFPTIDSYLHYKQPKKCDCTNEHTWQRRLLGNYPPYMRKTSNYMSEPMLRKYKLSSVESLKAMIERESPIGSISLAPSTKDVSTQYEDLQFVTLYECMTLKELLELNRHSRHISLAKKIEEPRRNFYLDLSLKSFATKRALSILNLFTESPELMEIFKSRNCNFDT